MDFDEADAFAVAEIQRIFIKAFDFHKANEYPTFLEQIHYYKRFSYDRWHVPQYFIQSTVQTQKIEKTIASIERFSFHGRSKNHSSD